MECAEAMEDRPKGPRFTKVYEAGWDRVEHLLTLKGGPTVGRLWVWLTRHAGHDNAVVVTGELLAEVLDVHIRSVRRAAAVLVKAEAMIVAKIGNANCYILNPGEVWKTYEDHKRFCGFTARAVVGFAENKGLRARLSHVFPQGSLELESGAKRARWQRAPATVA